MKYLFLDDNNTFQTDSGTLTKDNNFVEAPPTQVGFNLSGKNGNGGPNESNAVIVANATVNIPTIGLTARCVYAQFRTYDGDYYGLPQNPTTLEQKTSIYPELIDITHTFSNTAYPSNTFSLTVSPYSINIGNTTVKTVINSTAVFVGNSTVNACVNSTTVSLSNSTVKFTMTKPTADMITAGNYFMAANSTWVQLTVP